MVSEGPAAIFHFVDACSALQSELQRRDDAPAAAAAARHLSARASGGSSAAAAAPAPAPAPAAAPALGCVAGAGFVRAFGSKGSSNGQFKIPKFMAWDHQGNVAIADEYNHRVQVVRLSDGACLRTIGSEGSGAGQFNYPAGVALDGATSS